MTVAPLAPEAQRFRFEGGEIVCGERCRCRKRTVRRPLPPGAEQAVRSGEAPASAASLTELKPLGQVNASFIVAVNSEGLWIIDQHVAHERVLFEQHLRARREGALTGQRLLTPIVVELAPRQRVILDQIAEELSANGFDVTPMGAAQRGHSGRARGHIRARTPSGCWAKFWMASSARTRPSPSIRCKRRSRPPRRATRRSK